MILLNLSPIGTIIAGTAAWSPVFICLAGCGLLPSHILTHRVTATLDNDSESHMLFIQPHDLEFRHFGWSSTELLGRSCPFIRHWFCSAIYYWAPSASKSKWNAKIGWLGKVIRQGMRLTLDFVSCLCDFQQNSTIDLEGMTQHISIYTVLSWMGGLSPEQDILNLLSQMELLWVVDYLNYGFIVFY